MFFKEDGHITYTVDTSKLASCLFFPLPYVIQGTIMCEKLTDCKSLILLHTCIKIILQYYAKYGTQQM
jgi:hypothetical protein